MQSKEVDGLHVDRDAPLYAWLSAFLLAHKALRGSVGRAGTSSLTRTIQSPVHMTMCFSEHSGLGKKWV